MTRFTAGRRTRRRAAARTGRSSAKVRNAAPQDARKERRAERREAILSAALEEFSARGFTATRLDDVAQRAGVAKGTIYLYFRDKESLFQDIVRTMLSPLVGTIEHLLETDMPVRAIAEQVSELFVREVYLTRRRDVIRLMVAEGPRFPKLAEFYYREVLSGIMAAVRALLQRAAERGELKSEAAAQFPQLIGAPGIVAILWSGLFDRFEPLDVRAMLQAQFDLLFGEKSGGRR